jgi:hypothetical protein
MSKTMRMIVRYQDRDYMSAWKDTEGAEEIALFNDHALKAATGKLAYLELVDEYGDSSYFPARVLEQSIIKIETE